MTASYSDVQLQPARSDWNGGFASWENAGFVKNGGVNRYGCVFSETDASPSKNDLSKQGTGPQ